MKRRLPPGGAQIAAFAMCAPREAMNGEPGDHPVRPFALRGILMARFPPWLAPGARVCRPATVEFKFLMQFSRMEKPSTCLQTRQKVRLRQLALGFSHLPAACE